MINKNFTPIALLFLASPVMAEWSGTVTLASDYLFNGVSQTGEDPALQGSIDWAGDNWYAGAWGSNVDFGDDTNLEADVYVGYYTAINDMLNLDVGIAQYTYHGAGYSSDGNYAEAYAKFNIMGATDLNFWYSWDYFGTGAGHYIVMLNHTIEISEQFSLLLGVDRSTSLDSDKWQWEEGDDDYIHWQVTGNFSYSDFDFSLGVQGTDLDTYGDTTVLLTVGRTFEF
jgi:uncharacterized protein (TIGR02001 family)